MFTHILGRETILLDSSLSARECALRLQGAVRSRWKIFDTGAIIGWVDAAGFKIRNTGRRNFPLVMRGRFESGANGTRLVCRLGRNPAPFIGALIFGVAIVAMLVAGTVGAISRPTGDSLPQIVIPALFLLFFGFMMVTEFIRSKDDRDILLDFLRRVTEARSAGSQEAAAVQRRAG
jgi:hypothetical protein